MPRRISVGPVWSRSGVSVQAGLVGQVGRAGDLLVDDLGIVGGVQPVDGPIAAGLQRGEVRAGEQAVASALGARLARLDLVVLLLAGQHHAAVLLAQRGAGDAPLVRAGVEVADAAAGEHQVELPLGDVADVDDLHHQRLAAKALGASVAAGVVRLARELQLVAGAAAAPVEGGVGERLGVADGPGGHVPAGEGIPAAARALIAAAHRLVLFVAGLGGALAARVVRPRARRFAAVPETGRVALASAGGRGAHDRRAAGAGRAARPHRAARPRRRARTGRTAGPRRAAGPH